MAFQYAAADPSRFPEQLKELRPWKADRLLHNVSTWSLAPNTDLSMHLKLDVGAFEPLLGRSWGELAAQSRSQHTYMMGASVRFADVFVPNAGTTGNFNGSTATRSVGGVTTAPLKGVWRRVLLVGRGIGGKYLTALDVTSPGPYTRDTKDTTS